MATGPGTPHKAFAQIALAGFSFRAYSFRCSLGEARASVAVSPKFGELCVEFADALHKSLSVKSA
jgi:hypothetical protein